jgi:hypothetical protein
MPDSSGFAVINFGDTPPTVVMMPGPAGVMATGDNMVDCYGKLAAVGSYAGDSVTLFDIASPAAPVKIGTVEGINFQIGSISTDGSYVLVGEMERSSVALIDISDPAWPQILSYYDCAGQLNIITNVALRSPTAVVSGHNRALVLGCKNRRVGPADTITYDATGPSDFDGTTAAVASDHGIRAYAVFGSSNVPRGWDTTDLPVLPVGATSVAVAEIPGGGYFVAAGGIGSFTVFAYPPNSPSASIETPLQPGMSSMGTAVKFLNNPAIAPYLAVANLTESDGVFVSVYLIQVETGLPQTVISFVTPIPVAQVAAMTTEGYLRPPLPTLGITAFKPPGWLEKISRHRRLLVPGWLEKILQHRRLPIR